MQHDFDAIPEAATPRQAGSMLTRMYHDIGLAAIADALGLTNADFDEGLSESIERGQFYLLPIRSTVALAERVA